ncbi:MAG: Asp-tRNA(Asn)/Glu-tRNA(Gln) amidotransferase subunit GatC [Thermaurantimonas sp.]
MKITKDEIYKIAALAKLKIDEEQINSVESDMNKILAFVDKINELPLDGVEPLEYINEDINVLRKDEANFTVSQYDALKNASMKDTDYIKVPKVLG